MRGVINGGSQMRKAIIGAAAFGLALVSGAAVAQNAQGPAAPDYGIGGPNTGPSGRRRTPRRRSREIQTQVKGRSIITHPAREIIRRGANSVVEPPATNVRGSWPLQTSQRP